MNKYAIILAAGNGRRLAAKKPKCFIDINKKPIYQYSLELFQILPQIKQVILVVPKQYLSKIKPENDKVKIISGGLTRNESFELAIQAIKNIKINDKLIIHDAARINVQLQDIINVVKSKEKFGTLCYIGKANKSDFRIGKYNIQTPQFCLFSVYKKSHKNKLGKDLFSYLNLKPTLSNFIVSTNKEKNFKITFKSDLEKAKSI
ncbi:MAG: 2-C-methyl-D-erythritol 4-phosphate cytidylyltransferase [Mycoplasmoidaceae bacterium]|nr:2-C-methyl-D-erythritol 4-phosphate cytidylyltransferase [Mycoplasmoidaceae bacterium]